MTGAPNAPQMNGVMAAVERSFVTCRDRAFANMLAARFNGETQGILWTEAVTTATKIGNMIATKDQTNSPFEKWYSKDKKNRSYQQIPTVLWLCRLCHSADKDPEEVHTKINQMCDGGLCRRPCGSYLLVLQPCHQTNNFVSRCHKMDGMARPSHRYG